MRFANTFVLKVLILILLPLITKAQISIGDGSSGGQQDNDPKYILEKMPLRKIKNHKGKIIGNDSMIVIGEVGYEQNDYIYVGHCDQSSTGQLIYDSCDEKQRSFKLNEPIKVKDGIIYISFSGTIGFFKKKPNKPLHIYLDTYQFGLVNDDYGSTSLVRDYSDPAEFLKRKTQVFYIYLPLIMKNYCTKPEKEYIDKCNTLELSIQTSNIDLAYNSIFQIYNNKYESQFYTLNSINLAHVTFEQKEVSLLVPKKINTISVLPGAYTFIFKDKERNITWMNHEIIKNRSKNTLPRYELTERGPKTLEIESEGKWLEKVLLSKNLPNIKFFVYKTAAKICLTPINRIEYFIHDFRNLNDDKTLSFWTELDQIIPNAQSLLAEKDIIVAFSKLSENLKHNKAFHIKNAPKIKQNLITIDCSTILSGEWTSLLAHEFIHVILSDKNVPSWLEELLAQTAEFFIKNETPYNPSEVLQDKQNIPSPIILQRPFPSKESYAVNFLFGQYLMSEYGVSMALQALNPLTFVDGCSKSSYTLDEFSCRINKLREAQGLSEKFAPLSSHSILEMFYQTLNQK